MLELLAEAVPVRLRPVGYNGALIGADMTHEVTRRRLERWLLVHGFVELPGKKTGHRQFGRGSLKITVPGHGPQDLTKKHVALILRQLAQGGFDKDTVRRELAG